MTTETTAVDAAGASGPGQGRRMSQQRKRRAVLHLLCTIRRIVQGSEDLELVSRALGVTAAVLSGWRDAFLAAGEAGLRKSLGDFAGNPAHQWRSAGKRAAESQARRNAAETRTVRSRGCGAGGRPPFG